MRRSSPRRWLDAFVWGVLPGICILCNARTHVRLDLCEACRLALPWIDYPCKRCALPIGPNDSGFCTDCRTRPPPFVRTVAALRYLEPTTHMVHRLKFHGSRIDARVLGTLLAARILDCYRGDALPDVAIPVPLSRERLRRRGHNQAALLARWVGSGVDMPVEYRSCLRVRHTPPQTGLNRSARLRNLEGAFTIVRGLENARIAIVDDVMTTGSTVAALTHTLLQAGAAEVHVWAAARTPNRDSENAVPIGTSPNPLESPNPT